jgi:hypothetical protein
VREQFEVIATMLGRQFPKVETMLREVAEDITAFADFPVAHWKRIWSTNPLERVNKEIKRRTDVVGVFPNPEALLRLAGCVLIEVHDEWQVAERRYPSEGSMALIDTVTSEQPTPELTKEAATAELIASLARPAKPHTTTPAVTPSGGTSPLAARRTRRRLEDPGMTGLRAGTAGSLRHAEKAVDLICG